MKVHELKPNQKKISIVVKIEEIAEQREVVSKIDNKFHQVADALVGDETGCVYLSIWDDNLQYAKEGKYYKITNGYTSVYRSSLRLDLGKYEKLTETEARFEINTANNMSLKEL